MDWPEGKEWWATSYTCNSGGKLYMSSVGNVFMPWSEMVCIKHYENAEEFSNLGLPKK